jgi:hypothetical protein
VIALIDLVKRRDRTVRQSEPRAERSADLAAAAGPLDAVSRNLDREAVDELLGARGPSPARKRALCAESTSGSTTSNTLSSR